MCWKLLDWDTCFFCVKVARIFPEEISNSNLSSILYHLKESGVDLVYVASNNALDKSILERFGGIPVGQQAEFSMNLNKENVAEGGALSDVVPCGQQTLTANLKNLALQCGHLSRFSVDSNFPKEKFEALYTTWIERSIEKKIADEVLVIKRDGRIAGFVTLKKELGKGIIGLFVVDKRYRGQGFGKKLMLAAIHWFRTVGCDSVRVATQVANKPACSLYTHFGYTITNVSNYYHFWLKDT